jgi:hypothetical protein
MMTQFPISIKNKLLTLEAKRWLGIQENGGNNKGEIVSVFQKTIGKAENEPWCMSFVQYCLFQTDNWFYELCDSDIPHELFLSEHCLTVWNESPKHCRIEKPIAGSICIWQYRGSSNGHTGIVVDVDKEIIITIEGNTSNSKKIIREGDGVYLKRRPLKSIGKMQIKGFLNPWPPSV